MSMVHLEEQQRSTQNVLIDSKSQLDFLLPGHKEYCGIPDNLGDSTNMWIWVLWSEEMEIKHWDLQMMNTDT